MFVFLGVSAASPGGISVRHVNVCELDAVDIRPAGETATPASILRSISWKIGISTHLSFAAASITRQMNISVQNLLHK